MSTSRLAIGLDVGDSKSLLHADASSSPLELRSGGANPQRIGTDKAADVLVELIRKALTPYAPVAELVVCAGVAGAGRSSDQDALARPVESALEEDVGSVCVQVIHDATIALDTAFGPNSGLIVIAGSGSVAFARTEDGCRCRAGGWGYLIEDPGSGYALGQAGLRAVAQSLDGGRDTALASHLQEVHSIVDRDSLIQTVYDDGFRLQSVGPLVVEVAEDGDPAAERILTQQTEALARQVHWLVERCCALPPRMALLGGMTNNDYYVERLRTALHDRLPNWSIQRLEEPPVTGALQRARRMDP